MFWNRIIANKLRRIDLFFVYRKWYAWKKSVRLFVLGNVVSSFGKEISKTVHDYYSMDSFACGFETRSRVEGQPASHFLTAHAHSVRVARCRQTGTLPGCPVNAQRNNVIVPDVLLIFFLNY